MPKQSILYDYLCEVEENTGKDTEYYAVRLKYITGVTFTRTFAFLRSTRRTYRTLYYIGLQMVTQDEHGSELNNLVEI